MDGEDTTSRPVEGEEENSSEIQLEPTQEEMERERLTARAEQVRRLIHLLVPLEPAVTCRTSSECADVFAAVITVVDVTGVLGR